MIHICTPEYVNIKRLEIYVCVYVLTASHGHTPITKRTINIIQPGILVYTAPGIQQYNTKHEHFGGGTQSGVSHISCISCLKSKTSAKKKKKTSRKRTKRVTISTIRRQKNVGNRSSSHNDNRTQRASLSRWVARWPAATTCFPSRSHSLLVTAPFVPGRGRAY